jgi:hypothetical protein
MTKDLIIGGASNYTWDQLKYWVNSIKRSGFEGDIAIVSNSMKKTAIERLAKEGVDLKLYGRLNADGDVVPTNNSAPHVERFFYLWNYLETTKEEYNNVITTDTRDVIFQRNPSLWFDDKFNYLFASSEGMRYKNEPWNNQNMLESFGPYFHDFLKENLIFNVGVIAGETQTVKGLLSFIFHLSMNRPIPIVDQAVFNFIINQAPFRYDTEFTTNKDGWAIQLATTLGAVKSGKGDIGMIFKDDPTTYETLYEDEQPIIEDGVVKTLAGEPYFVVHQYDRVNGLKEKIEQIYGDEQ